MDPRHISKVRAQVQAQHEVLRRQLVRLDGLARQVLDGDGAAVMELRRQTVELELGLLTHLAYEEKYLLPLLERLDAWGDVRVLEMRTDHARQREVLALAGDEATSATVGPRQLGEMVRTLVADLLADMRREEEDLLHPDFLRDDLVAIDQTDG